MEARHVRGGTPDRRPILKSARGTGDRKISGRKVRLAYGESRIREHLSLCGALFLIQRPLLVKFGSGLGLGFRRIPDLDMSVVLRTAATHEYQRREQRKIQQVTAFLEAGLGQFGSPDK